MRFLAFEGLDGSGKSSLMSAMEKDLQIKGIKTLRTREPGGTILGDQLREMILSKDGDAPTPRTELLLYEAIRAQHVDRVIVPALTEKTWVLCDRFSASSIAFQAGGRQISKEWVEQLNEFATAGLKPSLTVLLDLSVEDSRKRRVQRQEKMGTIEDRIESEADSFHERVRSSFLELAESEPEHWLILNASDSIEELRRKTMHALLERGWLA